MTVASDIRKPFIGQLYAIEYHRLPWRSNVYIWYNWYDCVNRVNRSDEMCSKFTFPSDHISIQSSLLTHLYSPCLAQRSGHESFHALLSCIYIRKLIYCNFNYMKGIMLRLYTR